MNKRKMVEKSVFFQNVILKKYKSKLELLSGNEVAIQRMGYDWVRECLRGEYEASRDYCRYRTFELIADEIHQLYPGMDLSELCVAEAGVFHGDFAWIINRKFPECRLYLYDTFEGFSEKDKRIELAGGYISEEHLGQFSTLFQDEKNDANAKMQIVKSKMGYPEKCILKKGYFPDTAADEADKKWLFVSLDMDLYAPIMAGIEFFWPNVVKGGYMFIHDYNSENFSGVKKALAEAEDKFGRIHKVPISDRGGTVVLCK